MSVNVSVKNANHTKKKSPSSKKNSPTKTETSKKGSPSVLPTIDRYLIKKPARSGSPKPSGASLNDSNVSENDSQAREKVKASKSESNDRESATNEPVVIVADDDTDDSSAEKQNGNKQEKVKTNNKNAKNRKGKQTQSNVTRSEEKPAHISPSKSENDAEQGNSTDDVQSENEIETQESETQEYDIESREDSRMHVDYEDEDFNTDSDFDKWDIDIEGNDSEEDRKVKDRNTVQTKGPSTTLGDRKKKKRENCQGSSSEEEDDRPWQNNTPVKKKKFGDKPTHNYPTRSPKVPTLRRQWSDRDTQQYRAGYPNKRDDRKLNQNLHFYQGKIRSRPDGALIDDFHRDWWNNHDRLESHHGYIQWLFPIRESGMNLHAQELQLHEAEAIKKDPHAMKRFKKSYEMMLYFYGIKLANHNTGEVERADNWRPRFKHLNHSMHNYLRITRILKCLGEMGLESWKRPFLELMLHEAAVTRKLDRTLESCCNYWVGTVKNDVEREKLKTRAEQLYLAMR